MDYHRIIWAAIGGGLGGLIGALAGQKLQSKTWKLVATIVPVVAFAQIVPMIAGKYFAGTPFERTLQDGGGLLANHAGFRKAIAGMSGQQIHDFTQKQAHLGLKRLPSADLLRWNDLRLKMAESNPILCAGFWTGKGITGAAVQSVLEKMPQAEMEEWTSISVRAALLEIDQAPVPPVPAETMTNGIAGIARGLSKPDVQRVQTAMLAAGAVKDEDACWVMKTFLTGAKKLPQPLQEQFIRALASI